MSFSQVVSKVSWVGHRTSHTSVSTLSKTLSKVPNVLHRGPNFQPVFNEPKALILECLHLSVHLRIAFSTRSHVGYTSPHGNDGKVHARYTARVRAQMDGWPLSPLTPQSLTTPQPRHRSTNHDYYSARSHQFCSANVRF